MSIQAIHVIGRQSDGTLIMGPDADYTRKGDPCKKSQLAVGSPPVTCCAASTWIKADAEKSKPGPRQTTFKVTFQNPK